MCGDKIKKNSSEVKSIFFSRFLQLLPKIVLSYQEQKNQKLLFQKWTPFYIGIVTTTTIYKNENLKRNITGTWTSSNKIQMQEIQQKISREKFKNFKNQEI